MDCVSPKKGFYFYMGLLMQAAFLWESPGVPPLIK